MPATVTKTVKALGGGDYTTWASAEAAIPSDISTATGTDQKWVIEGYNDAEHAGGVTVAGVTTDVAARIVLTAAAGQSFQDHAGVRSNPQAYDQSKGVGIRGTSGGSAVTVNNAHVTVERLQVIRTTSAYDSECVAILTSNVLVQNNIIGQDGLSSNAHSVVYGGEGAFYNNLIYDQTTSGTSYGIRMVGNFIIMGNTIVNGRGSAQGRGIDLVYGTGIAINNAVFGWSVAVNGTAISNSQYNATDDSSFPGTSNQVSKTYANQFVSTTSDWRTKAGSDCIDTGTTAGLAADISGLARPQGSAYDIGAWEYAAAAPSVSYAALMGTTTTIGGAARG